MKPPKSNPVVVVKPSRKLKEPYHTGAIFKNKEDERMEAPGTLPRGKPNPMAMAVAWLGPRLAEHYSAGKAEYRLDGRPVNLKDIIMELNRMLKARNADQVGPEHCRVP